MTEKIKLSGLESFLMRIADYLRKNMEESEYKEYIFGLLFLKRMSDVFEEKRENLKKEVYHHLSEEDLMSILEDKNTYGDTFFVPKRARWSEGWYDEENETEVPALRDLKTDIGPMLNKALTAIEDANSEVLQGIFKDRINFNKMSVDGTPVVKNSDLRKMIEEFNNFPPLLNKNFEFPDLLGAAYEFVLKYFADSAGKKGGEFYTPNTVVRMLVKLLQVDEGMSIYDPTVGSGGMLIQSYQYIEDEGKNPKNLALYGQDNKDGVVAICKMNMIFHDIFGSHIKYGDTLVNPQHTKNGKIMKFDRVIANPPFSLNYSTEEMKYKDRFIYGFTPEDAKQADLMFVQHMLASCDENKGGRVVVVMPHGVLFRGRKEKEIRTAMLQRDVDVLEGVISLPPQLFYGTGIPACVMVFSKRKSDDMKGKVFFINADREYKEGKKQNTLRPEDIEKISYVYLNKMEVPNYSRLVDLSEIEQNGYTLNIRKYVDNTPAPEHHDVHAHLVGGVPAVEIEEINSNLSSKIHFDAFTLFSSGNDSYRQFAVSNRDEIKQVVEESSEVNAVVSQLHDNLFAWWKTASEEFATIAGHRDALLPKVRNSLMQSMRQALEPVGMLDQHQVAGIFVNWWDGVKYDLKIIMQRKWDIDLIYPEYRDLVTAMFFADERQAIDKKQEDVANCEANIEDIVEQILESVDYEPEEPAEGEEAKEIKHTPKLAHEQLAVALKGCEEDSDDANELKAYSAQLKDCEEALKAAKSELDQLQKTLDLHLELKCLGVESKKQYVVGLLNQANNEIAEVTQHATAFLEQSGLQFCIPSEDASIETILASLDEIKKSVPSNKNKRTAEQNALLTKVAQAKDVLKEPKKKFTKLQKEVVKIQQVLSGYDDTMQSIGGQITEEETRTLILQKHYNIIAEYLTDYIDKNYFQGTGLKNLQKKDFKRHEIIIPKSKDEQQRIADALSKLDDSLSQTQSLIDKYELIKRGLMQDLLTFGIDSEGNVRSEKTHKFKDSPLGRIPEEWECKLIKEIYTSIKSGITPSRSVSSFFEPGLYPWAKTLDLNEDEIYKTDEYVSEFCMQNTSLKLQPKNSVLIAMYGGWIQIGRTSILKVESGINQAICALSSPRYDINSYYTLYYLQQNRLRWRKNAISTRKDPNITKKDVENFYISFPSSPKEQRMIVKTIQDINALNSKHSEQILSLINQKQGLLSDLITGKVRI